jgi:Domain of unknown function (DUF4388)
MTEERRTMDRMPDAPADRAGVASPGGGATPPPPTATVYGTAVGVTGRGSHSADRGGPNQPASLVGSLSSFPLADVLLLLASTAQSGELQVASEEVADEGVHGKVWLAQGELSNAEVGSTPTIGQAVFELACVTEGWFSFTAGQLSSSGQPTAPVAAVLAEVRPRVDEWRKICALIPLEGTVRLAPNPPNQEVRIRSDQWRVLTTVGTTGQPVRSVLDQIGGEQIVSLRTLRDLHGEGLIVVSTGDDPIGESSVPAADTPSASPLAAAADSGGWTPPDGRASGSASPTAARFEPAGTGTEGHHSEVPGETPSHTSEHSDGPRFNGLADVAMMPPPITRDPWAPSADPDTPSGNSVA